MCGGVWRVVCGGWCVVCVCGGVCGGGGVVVVVVVGVVVVVVVCMVCGG